MLQKLWCYATGPIDFWDGCVDKTKFLKSMTCTRSDLNRIEGAALGAFRLLGWEGDVRSGPYFFALPDPPNCTMQLGLAVKQDNGGRCFFASPFRLPYLEDSPEPSETWCTTQVELE